MVTVYRGFCTPQHGSKATVRMINCDATGTGGGGGGSTSPTSLLKLLPNPGGNMSSGANWEETDYFRIEAEAPFTRVRLWMFSQDTTQTTGWRAIVAPTETGASDTLSHCFDPIVGGSVDNAKWKTVTFGGGTGTMPANSGAARQGVMVSDWCTVSSVARTDGTRPMLLCRPYHNSSSGGTHTSQNYAGVHTSSAETFYRRYEVGAIVGNGLDTLATQPSGVFNDASSGFPFAVEFDYGLTTAKPVLSVGDSITGGTYTDLSNSSAFGWIQAGVMGLSTPATPYSIANGGSPGQISTAFFNEANDMLDAGLRPAYIVLPSFTVNDAPADGLTTAIVDAYYVQVDALIAKVAGYSPRPKFIGWTGLPRNSYTATSETARQYAHTQMRNRVSGGSVYRCVEVSAAIQDGSSPPDIQAIYDAGDGVHPNDTARPVMAALLAAAFP